MATTGPAGDLRYARRRWALPAAGALVLVAALTACTGQGSAGTSSGPTSGAARGTGTGSYAYADYDPGSLIPGNSYAYEINALFAPLTVIQADGSLSNLQAEKVSSTDNKTWTIVLKPSWTFQDGTPVTSASFVDAWNATADATNAWLLNGQFVNIAGYDALNPPSGKPTTTKLTGLKIVDDTTFTVTLKQPDSQFPIALSSSAFSPLPASAFKDFKAFDKHPIGNGPYQLEGTWETGQKSLTLNRFAAYKGTPGYAATVKIKVYDDLATAYTDVRGGSVDITSVSADRLGVVKSDFPNGTVPVATPAIDFLGAPAWDARFSNPDLRRAFSLAIDRVAINKALSGSFNTPAAAYVSPAVKGAPQDLCDYCKLDVEKAKSLLAQAGGWSGPLNLWYVSGSGSDQLFQAIGNQLRQNLGIDVQYKTQSYAQFQDSLTAKKVDGLYSGHWGSFFPTMSEPLEALFTPEGAGFNSTQYSNPAATALIQQGNAATSQDAAVAAYTQAQTTILSAAPIIPLFFDTFVYAHGPHVTSIEANPAFFDFGAVQVK
jgi:peptide/nickel transport system substrate-binding protein/oligopeptide transport system substrate-binding protein